MQRAPALVLMCGLLGVGVGAALLAVSGQVDGLVWLATPITVLGLLLVGLWLRGRSPGGGPEATTPPEPPPGRWYPFAVVGVGLALWAWAVYWTKFR
jgi:hypothetical protein